MQKNQLSKTKRLFISRFFFLLSLLIMGIVAGCDSSPLTQQDEQAVPTVVSTPTVIAPTVRTPTVIVATATPFSLLELDEWQDDVRRFPIIPANTENLTFPDAQLAIIDSVRSFYGPSGYDLTLYRQYQIHKWSNLFSHPTSSGFPFDQLATSDHGAVYASNHDFALIPIYPGRVGSHDRRQPFLFFFDRHQNVYGTGLIGGMRGSYAVDNGYVFHFNQSISSGDSQPFSVAHLIMNVNPPIIYSLGDFTYGRLVTPYADVQFRSGRVKLSRTSQNFHLQHVMNPEAVTAYGKANNGQLPCGFKIDSFDAYYELAVETEYIRADSRYIRGETTVAHIRAMEYSPAIKTSVNKEIEDWTVYCEQ